MKLHLYFAASETSTVSGTSSATSAVRKAPELPKDKPSGGGASGAPDAPEDNEEEPASAELGPEGEDTMKNLRKTFAGIFGDIN